ncbi:MAG: phenylalanine--tRNA ligase subunit beta [Gemmatimonadetes bacterium]|nr:phenylalanine--tRNA ligase subunit beta [Gemmatimonadota bacterium]
MNVSTRWLKDMVPGLSGSPKELAEHLALRGAPVEEITSPGEALGDIVVGKVVTAGQHPNADRLSLCEVDGGDGVVQVVCGAPNVKAGSFYPFAPVGSVLPGDFKIKKAKIRGEVSQGMLCSSKELGLGTDHEGILEIHGDFKPGQSFVHALGLGDATLDVEITANRGDLLSHAGVARELASEGDGRVVFPDFPDATELAPEYVVDAKEAVAGEVSIRIDDPDLCSRYLGAVIRGVAIGPSPAWLQERLRGAGSRPINNVVDATNYVMLEMGQPLHAFDLDQLAGSSIVVRRAGKDESKFTTLDDEDRTLTDDMLMICDAGGPVAIAGVMGGQNSEVEEATRDVLLECAHFDPKSIRSTRKALGMSTDASYRFERGVDPEGMQIALERCAALIIATAGGELDGPVLDCSPHPFEAQVVDLRLSRVHRLLGIPFDARYVTRLLEPLGFTVGGETDGVLHVRVPGYRSYDVTREVDLIEEVARTHGYDAFPSDLRPSRPGTVPDHPLFQLEDRIRAALVGQGLFETQTPAFAPANEGDVEVANPLATTEPVMRVALLPSLVRRLEYNLARGNRDVRLFEIGTSFSRTASGCPPHEETHLAAIVTGRRTPPHWSVADEALSIWDLKGLFAEMLETAYHGGARLLPGSEVPASTSEPVRGLASRLDPDRSLVAVSDDGSVIGWGGRMADGAVDTPPWAGDVFTFELRLPDEPRPAPVATYDPLPHYPAVERDLALVVPDALPVGDVDDVVRTTAGRELEALEIFDVYTGEGVPEGTRSVAVRLRFRSAKGTLKDKAVDRSVGKVLQRLEEELGVKARG